MREPLRNYDIRQLPPGMLADFELTRFLTEAQAGGDLVRAGMLEAEQRARSITRQPIHGTGPTTAPHARHGPAY